MSYPRSHSSVSWVSEYGTGQENRTVTALPPYKKNSTLCKRTHPSQEHSVSVWVLYYNCLGFFPSGEWKGTKQSCQHLTPLVHEDTHPRNMYRGSLSG